VSPGDGTCVVIGLGGNMGDRLARLRDGVRGLAAHPSLTLTAVSSVWESEFVGEGTQAPYLNACVTLRTGLGPAAVLEACRDLERAAGRAPGTHLAPRPLDLDLLLHGDFHGADGPALVPHPRARERAFVLEPLAEIAPDLRFPDSGETVATACANIRRKPGPWLRLRTDLSLWPADLPPVEEVPGAAVAVHRR